MDQKVEIEISGHKAWIENVTAQAAGGILVPWDDRLCVFLSFDESVESILGFYVYLPVHPAAYGKEVFLEAVKREGEKELERHLRLARVVRAQRVQEEEKQRALDRIAEAVKTAIGLTESG